MIGRAWSYPQLWEGCVGAWCPSQQRFPASTVIDYSGSNNHGTLTNMDVDGDWVGSPGGMALDFDATNDFVQIAGPTVVAAAGSPWAISFWNYARGIGSGRPWMWNASALFNNDADFLFGAITINGAPVLNAWRHIVCQFTGTTSELYLDRAVLSSANTASIEFTLADFTWGNQNAGTNRPANGLLDDMRIYNRTLSVSEIRVLSRRRGIAYDKAPRRSYKAAAAGGFKAAWASRRSQIIGGGVR